MKKLTIILLLVIIASLCSWGVVSLETAPKIVKLEKSEVKQKTLNFNLGSEPGTLDPQLNKDLYGGSLINNMFEGLFRRVNNQIIPAIANDYLVSSDHLTYTFNLKSTYWSDGTPLTAHDFEFAWKRALDPKLASEYAYQLFIIKGAEDYFLGNTSEDKIEIHALDDLTLEVKLQTPAPYFIDLLSSFTFMPCKSEVVLSSNNGSWAFSPETAISNGPFKLKEYRSGDKIVLEKNPFYWNKSTVNIDFINVSMVNDSSTTLTAYENGEFDIIDSVPVSEIHKLINENPNFHVVPSIATAYYLLNVNVKPLDNIDVRKALALAIDRKALVDTVTKAGELPAVSFTPPGLLDANGNDFHQIAGNYDINPENSNITFAQELLGKAGYVDGAGFPELEILYNTSETNELLASAIQEMWLKNLNIKVKLVNQEFAVFQSFKSQGNYQIARGSWFGDYADPLAMLEIWTSDNPINTTGWHNTQYDALIKNSKTANDQERYALLYEAQEILMTELPIIPLYYYTDVYMASDKVTNFEKTSTGLWYFGLTDLN